MASKRMAGGVRDRMIAGAVRLLARRGLQATSFSTSSRARRRTRLPSHSSVLDAATAESATALLLAASEGAVLMCRAEKTSGPLTRWPPRSSATSATLPTAGSRAAALPAG
jgi:hypothetical protein